MPRDDFRGIRKPVDIQKTQHPKSRPSEKDLGFGQYFTDHMLLMEYTSASGWGEPRILPYGPLALDPAAAVFHYGQAMFEGAKVFRGTDGEIRFFRPEFHLERMAKGAARLCMPAIPVEVARKALQKLVEIDADWIPRTEGCSLYLRPTLIGTEGFLGVRPAQRYLFYVILSPVGSYYSEGVNPVRIWVETETIRAAQGGLGSVKAGANYASSLLASQSAKKAGFSQVLWLDALEHKWIEEVGTMNVFFRIGDEIVTPPLGGTILGGVTRDSSLRLLREWGMKVSERRISIDEVRTAHASGNLKEVFGTGTAAVISPVGELAWKGGNLMLGKSMGEVATRLYQKITDIQFGRTADAYGWTETL